MRLLDRARGESGVRVTAPIRVQLRRQRGWRLPPNTVKVDRATRWGNPYRIVPEDGAFAVVVGKPVRFRLGVFKTEAAAIVCALLAFRTALIGQAGCVTETVESVRLMLRGKNLACWCREGYACHADVLLEVANGPPAPDGRDG